MTKNDFLSSIKQSACMSSRVAKVWDAAVKTDAGDQRWQQVEDHPDQDIRIQSFGVAFGVEVQPIQVRRQRMTHAEKLELDIAKLKASIEGISNPKMVARKLESIKDLEVTLAKLNGHRG